MVETVDIAPKVGYLEILSSINYREWYALAEFIDNSIQSYNEFKLQIRKTDKSFKLKIDVEIDSKDKVIIIRDNAAGINKANYGRAFRAAARPKNQEGLSEFGMGMKTAACWFSPKWEVITTALGEREEKTIRFDLKKIVKDDLTELEIHSRNIAPDKHFTTVILHNIRRVPKGATIVAIKNHIAEMYRKFLVSGQVEIYFKTSSSGKKEKLEYKMPEVMNAPYYRDIEDHVKKPKKILWKSNVDIKIDKKRRVTGFVALREKGNASQAGFSLFRRNRLIMGTGDEKYRPHKIFRAPNSFTYQRLFGDLDFHEFDVSHTKDGFMWTPAEEELFLSKLITSLNSATKPILVQAEKFRVKKNVPPKIKENKLAVEDAIRKASDAAEIISKIKPSEVQPAESPIRIRQASQKSERVIEFNGEKYKVAIVADFDSNHEDWYRLTQNNKSIQIIMNMQHQFTIGYLGDVPEEQEGLYLLLMYMGLAEIYFENRGNSQPIGMIRHTINKILRQQPPKY